MTTSNLSFAEYSMITESLDLDPGEIHRDHHTEMMARSLLDPVSHDSLRVIYNKHMDDNNLRLIKFENQKGEVEYHVHNTTMMPGLKSDNVSKLGFMSVAKIIHDDGAQEIAKGKTLRFQSVEGSPQHAKYKNIIERIAKKTGRVVKHMGMQPITSAPFLRGEVMLVEMTTLTNVDTDRNDCRGG